MTQLILVAHDIRSTLNVGSLFRTADGLAVEKIFLTGYTPYPVHKDDERLPHLSAKLTRQINKSALGAIENVLWEHIDNVGSVIDNLKKQGYVVAGLEQDQSSLLVPDYQPPNKLAIIVGSERTGLDDSVKKKCDVLLEIPMLGKKESFNVAVAAALVLYQMRYFAKTDK